MVNPPTIITEDGWKFLSNGLLERWSIPADSDLRYVFGEMPLKNTREYKVRKKQTRVTVM